MKCVICNSSDVEMKKVDEEIRSEKDILLIPMEVLVCLDCGERYYDRKAMRRIEEVRTKLKSHEIKVKEVGKVWVEQAA
jgi:YgiT-type zinc finger domain-containing protein